MSTYTAVITREDGDWLADIPELDGASTYASTLPRLLENLREVAILADGLPDDAAPAFDLRFEVDDQDVREASLLRAERSRIDREAESLRARTSKALGVLVKDGYSTRDAAEIVGVSPGRVSQLLKA